jgi:rubredoxin
MLGLRVVVCTDCETVYSVPEMPPRCDRCDGTDFEDLTTTLARDDYFLPAEDRD